jgi:16S rRNA G966 N2-methylase RsmD
VTISKNILPANPKLSYLEHKKEIHEAIERVLESGFYIMGSECDLFEKEFAQYLGVKYCIGVNSGTDAIILAIKSLELEAGSEVILPSHTSQGSLVGIYENNLKPIFCDIDQKTFNITLENVLAKITPKTKAIVGVHLYGQAFEVAKIADFCKEQKIYLIEDCAQAHGAEFNQKKVGSFEGNGFNRGHLEIIAKNLFKIRHWNIKLDSYENIENENVTWFIDPPYMFGGEHYKQSNKNLDFKQLGEWCKSRNGQSIVCENSKADWLDFKPIIKMQGTIHKTTEVIYSNYPTEFDYQMQSLF